MGFTLIELAIVLVIVGVLIGSFIGTLTTRIENMRVAETRDEMEEIKSAIIGFAYRYGYLPCADCFVTACNPGFVRDGFEDRTGGVCDAGNQVGQVPWKTLGLGQADAWGTHYRYWVEPAFADSAALFSLTTAANGSIDTRDNADALQTLANNVAVVVFSHGKNKLDGYSIDGVKQGVMPGAHVDETENVNHDNKFVSRPPTAEGAATAGGEFDDIVDWISEFELKAKMVEAGILPRP